MLSSAEEQLQYQRNVPFVNITVELICGWFDDHYGPDSRDFMAAFSTPELIAMARFDQLFNDILNFGGLREETPEIEDLVKTPEWAHLMQEAAQTLEVLERNNDA